MPNISDIIETFLLELFNSEESLSISRNELASYFDCAPSQINYVLSTRFTPDKGFTVQSRRGGGGSITVIKVSETPDDLLKKIMAHPVAEGLTQNAAFSIADRLNGLNYLTDGETLILKAALSDRALIAPLGSGKDNLRVSIYKSVVAELMRRGRLQAAAESGEQAEPNEPAEAQAQEQPEDGVQDGGGEE